VVASKNELASQVSALQAEVQSLSEKAATVDTLTGQISEWKGKAEKAEGKFSRWQAIASGIGTTDTEAIEAAEWAYGRLPEEDRPQLGDWLSGLREKPETAPKVLSPWLSPATDSKPDSTPPTRTKTTPPASNGKTTPRAPARGAQAPGAPSSLSVEAVRAAKERGIKTGDWSAYRELVQAAGFRTNAPKSG